MNLTGIGVPTWGAVDIRAACPPSRAIHALRHALREGLDPARAKARTQVPVSSGELLLMPSEYGRYAGVKITGVAPGNPAHGLPRITGLYLLLEAATLRPLAVLDGEQLTLTRTAAVSALAVDHLAVPDARRMLLFGTGPQALAHAEAVHSVRPLERLDIAGRRPAAVEDLRARCRELGIPAGPAPEDAVRHADLVVCCTSSPRPLFDGRLLAGHATVVAMGSHSPEARESDDATVSRSFVVVEDLRTALREAGDIALPVKSGLLDPGAPHTLADVVRNPPSGLDTPRLFKSVGMAWQDLVVAARLHEAAAPGAGRD